MSDESSAPRQPLSRDEWGLWQFESGRTNGLDPLVASHSEFPFDEMSRALGEPPEDEHRREALAHYIGELLRWLTKGDDIRIMGRRAIALAALVDPGIRGPPTS